MFARQSNRRWMLATGVMAALAMFVMADVGWSQPPEGRRPRQGRMLRGPGGPAGGLGLPLSRLDLTEDQRAQVRSVMEQNQAALREAEGRVRSAREALSGAVSADVLNEGAIRAVAIELGVAEGDAAVQRAYVRSQIWQLLTPEQQTAALEAQAEFGERRDHRRERMRERRGRRGGA